MQTTVCQPAEDRTAALQLRPTEQRAERPATSRHTGRERSLQVRGWGTCGNQTDKEGPTHNTQIRHRTQRRAREKESEMGRHRDADASPPHTHTQCQRRTDEEKRPTDNMRERKTENKRQGTRDRQGERSSQTENERGPDEYEWKPWGADLNPQAPVPGTGQKGLQTAHPLCPEFP